MESTPRFPHSQQADDEADGKVENQNQVSHFPTARFSLPKEQNQSALRSVRTSNNPREATGKMIVAKTEKYLTPNNLQATRSQMETG
jgi:hypothetical protein